MNNAFSQHYLAQFGIKPSRHIFNNFGMPTFDNGEGTFYFRCEVPIAKNGELIEAGKTYRTQPFDRFKVIKMELDTRYAEHTWNIVGVDEETGEEKDWLMVFQFWKVTDKG